MPTSRRGQSASPTSPRAAGLTHPSIYGGVDRKRFIIETNGAGVALVDYDRDGWLDALVLSGTRLADGERRDASFRARRGALESPVPQPARRHVRGRDRSRSVCAARDGPPASAPATIDNDGWLDLFLTYYGRNVLYRNDAGREFQDVTAAAGLGGRDVRWGSGCTFIDYDRDGRLDLFVSNYLRFDLEAADGAGEGSELPVEGRAGELRSEGAADRHQPALPQSRRRRRSRTCRQRPASRA